jgi:hypothetical protein
VNVVTVAALQEPFIHAMVIGFGEVRLGRGVTAVAEVGLGTGQQVLRLFGMMRRMAIDASNVVVVV